MLLLQNEAMAPSMDAVDMAFREAIIRRHLPDVFTALAESRLASPEVLLECYRQVMAMDGQYHAEIASILSQAILDAQRDEDLSMSNYKRPRLQ